MKKRTAASQHKRANGDKDTRSIVARPHPKLRRLIAGHSGPHARFQQAARGPDQPAAGARQQPPSRKSTNKASASPPDSGKRSPGSKARTPVAARQKVRPIREPVVSVFGRRLSPHPKPRT